jgi:hypothetical protein
MPAFSHGVCLLKHLGRGTSRVPLLGTNPALIFPNGISFVALKHQHASIV